MKCGASLLVRSMFLASALLSSGAMASSALSAVGMSPGGTVPAQCFVKAGERFRIDPLLLFAIAEVESKFDPAAKNHNRDGSVDFGLMQINSRHLPRLQSQGVTAQRLLSEPCLSVHVGAEILAGMIRRHGYSWEAVGAYNAGGSAARQSARQRYAVKVWQRYRTLVAEREASRTTGLSVPATASRAADPQPIPRNDSASRRSKPAAIGWQWRADDDLRAGLKALRQPEKRKEEKANVSEIQSVADRIRSNYQTANR